MNSASDPASCSVSSPELKISELLPKADSSTFSVTTGDCLLEPLLIDYGKIVRALLNKRTIAYSVTVKFTDCLVFLFSRKRYLEDLDFF